MFKKFFLKVLFAVMAINFLSVTPVQASIETVTGTGEYIMSMKETPEFAQKNAKLYAERAAIEQAGIFIASVSISKNFQLQDEITTFAAGLLKNITVVKNEMLPLTGSAAGYIKVVVTVEAQVDSDDFETALKKWQNKDSNEKSNLVEQNKSQQELIEEQAKRIKELEQKLANIQTEQDKQNVQQEIKEIDKDALYIQKIDDGWKFYKDKNFNKALELFNEAVALNPNDYQGYYGRGTTYRCLSKYDESLTDLNKAIQLNPNNAAAYNDRGNAYSYLKQYDAAVADYNKSLQLNPNDAAAYNNRGNAYSYLKQYDAAITDYNKSLQLNPNDADAYYNRGLAYCELKQYQKAIADFTKYIQFNSKFMWAYVNRGKCYQALGETAKAETDFAKARELGYKG